MRRRPNKVFELFVIAVLLLGIHSLVIADPLGTISGTISMKGGGGISGATVTLTSSCETRAVTTDASGSFTASNLPACTYIVSASAPGYAEAGMSVKLAAGATGHASFALLTQTKPTQKVEKKLDADRTAPSSPTPMVEAAPPPAQAPVAGNVRYHMSPAKPALRQQTVGDALEMDPRMNTEAYARIDENAFQAVSQHPLSTFGADVDTASYSNTRRFLKTNQLPPKDAVRLEEMINYFHYDLPAPPKDQPFSITAEVGQSPFNSNYQLVRIALASAKIDDAKVPPRNLTFLIDVSGSMEEPNKLPLLKNALNLLVETLRPEDKVAMVVYAGNSGLVLPPTSGREKSAIRGAIQQLEAGGSTNGAAGIQLAYETAAKSFVKGGINRVILCTDGDFNVGVTSEGDLTRLIEEKREHGVFLTALGFGMGNYKDTTMQKLADRGNGNYAYIDTISEARKVLVKEAGATLVTVAKDVKLQIEFNPSQVAGYRLIGYEKRILEDKDFNDDKKDSGDMGAGHNVTAMYEIIPAGQEVPGSKVDALKYQKTSTQQAGASDELMTVKVRYKQPDGKTSKLLSQPVKQAHTPLAQTSIDFRFAVAVAGFGMMLRESPNRGNLSWDEVQKLADGSVGPDAEGYRRELTQLVKIAAKLKRP
ncbi:MAG: von Willebrand factor type A domain-containing protein [Kofleriaceae bacterium]